MITREQAIKKIRDDDFFFTDDNIRKLFGEEGTEELKRENPEYYCLLRDSPMGMPSDIITENETEKHMDEYKRE